MAGLSGSALKVFGSGFDPRRHGRYAPNPVQQEFMRLCSQENHFLGFADTAHVHPEIQAFVLSQETLGILSETDKKRLFIERSPGMNPYFEAVRSGREPRFFNRLRRLSLLPEMASYSEQKKIVPVFEKAARDHSDVHIVGIDRRASLLGQLKMTLSVPVASAVITFKALRALFDFSNEDGGSFGGHMGCFFRQLNPATVAKNTGWLRNDDPNAVQRVKAHDGPSAIFYGAAHFNQMLEQPGADNSMRALLPEEDKSLCVLEIHKRDRSRLPLSQDASIMDHISEQLSSFRDRFTQAAGQLYLDGATLPDARLYALPSMANPHGIEVVNPAYQALYDQAVETVEAGVA